MEDLISLGWENIYGSISNALGGGGGKECELEVGNSTQTGDPSVPPLAVSTSFILCFIELLMSPHVSTLYVYHFPSLPTRKLHALAII